MWRICMIHRLSTSLLRLSNEISRTGRCASDIHRWYRA